MRYFLHLSYNGHHYAGWQSQPNATGVQAVIEDRLSVILGKEIRITGCGRTDTGVHASDYFAHFDSEQEIPGNLTFRLNAFLPDDIAIKKIFNVAPGAHARFDALRRSYTYYIHFQKDPFKNACSFYYRNGRRFDLSTLNRFANRLTDYKTFAPFAKLHSDVKTYHCDLSRCEWVRSGDCSISLHLTADRFLRGMVRLITGACLYFADGKLSIQDLETAMEKQEKLPKNWSVPAHGLFLSKIEYPEGLMADNTPMDE